MFPPDWIFITSVATYGHSDGPRHKPIKFIGWTNQRTKVSAKISILIFVTNIKQVMVAANKYSSSG